MKKNIILLMTGIAAMLASCSQNEEPLAAGDDLQSVTIRLTADGGDLRTRATSTVAIDRYVMEVYEVEEGIGLAPANVFGDTHRAEQTTPSFSLVLDRTQTYHCLFWADNKAGDIYDVSTLLPVQLKEDRQAIENSFYASEVISGDATTYDVTLRRAVAKVRLGEKDLIKAGSTLTARYTMNTGFGVLGGIIMKSTDYTATFTIAEDIRGTADAPTQIGEPFYMLAPDNEANVTTFTFKLNDEPEKTVDNVPVRANHSVFIRGEFSAYTEKAFTVTADDGWAEPENDTPLDPGYTLSTDAEGKKTYTVYNATGLLAWNEAIADDPTINLTLTDDIVMPAVAPGESNWRRANVAYAGTIDGDGHKIKGLVVDDVTTDYVGFVKQLGSKGHIKNLGLTDGSIKGRRFVGGLAGETNGRIENCHNANSVYTISFYAGGITGKCNRGTIVACYNTGAISHSATSGYSNVGGIAGGTEDTSNIYVCYNTGSIFGCMAIGGLVGDCTIPDADYLMLCYNTGTVTSTANPLENVGAVAGRCRKEAFNNGQIGYNAYSGNAGLKGLGSLATDDLNGPDDYSVLYSTDEKPAAARTAAGWKWVNPGNDTTPPTGFEKI